MPLTRKNVYGVVGIAVIALLWTAIIGVLGGVVVIVLVVALVVILNARLRRRRPDKGPEVNETR